MDILRTLVFSVVLVVTIAEENVTTYQRAGTLGQNVKLSCLVSAFSKPPKVRWEDTVYTSTRDPIVIFRSENNPNFSINSIHPNRGNYKVDRNNFELRINKLTFDDTGIYTCISEVGDKVHKYSSDLAIHRPLNCTGKTQLLEGQNTTLRCVVTYSGGRPDLDWFNGGEKLDSVDDSDLIEKIVYSKEAHLTATYDLDAKTIECRMKFADKTEHCDRHLNITYPVRDVMFERNQKNFYSGETITCLAKGNPAPDIHLVSSDPTENLRGKSSITIPKMWEGMTKTFECVASNTYLGTPRSIRTSMTFQVLAATTTTSTTRKPNVDPAKPADGGGNSSGKGSSGWTTLSFLVLCFLEMIFESC